MTKEELKQKAYEYAIKEIPFIECITQNDYDGSLEIHFEELKKQAE